MAGRGIGEGVSGKSVGAASVLLFVMDDQQRLYFGGVFFIETLRRGPLRFSQDLRSIFGNWEYILRQGEYYENQYWLC